MEIPVYEEMLLEAHKAHFENEYNKAILFSVIATEALLANTYDKIYAKEKLKNNKNKNLRLIQNPNGTFKDPVLNILLDRTEFKKLLHEIPLYLMRKSMLLEKENIYKNSLKMYNTRNKIVHWGAPTEYILID